MSARRSRLRHACLAALALVSVTGCGEEADNLATAGDAIVNVPHTSVESQTINNCWLYAHGSWIESMYLTATEKVFDASQSYWSYWHWLDQIAGGDTRIAADDVVGSWGTANALIEKYGLIDEGTFLRADGRSESSVRQKEALAAINASLTNGPLSSASARRDRRQVRAEMDRVWGLGDRQRAMLDQVFGPDARRNFTSGADNAGTAILRAEQFPAAYNRGPGNPVRTSLAVAMRDWQKVNYTGGAVISRVQRALHDLNPVYMTWLVDMNAVERGAFSMETWRKNGSGAQGIHMTVIDDYQAVLADGSVLPVKRNASAQDLRRALEPGARVQFFRVKNSWGSGGQSLPSMSGYYDLYLDYLNGPIAGRAPLRHVYLPPGY